MPQTFTGAKPAKYFRCDYVNRDDGQRECRERHQVETALSNFFNETFLFSSKSNGIGMHG